MNTIELVVPGIPRPQPRPRVTKTGHAFNPTTEGLKLWKTHLRLAARQKTPRSPWEQAVRVDVEAYFPRPSWLERVLPDQSLPMLERPDRDNLDKTILDTLTGLGYWRDDSQVYRGTLAKYYVQSGYGPGALITITFIELDAVYAQAARLHSEKVRDTREKREQRVMSGKTAGRPRPVLDGPRLINDTVSMDDLAEMMKAGRKVRA